MKNLHLTFVYVVPVKSKVEIFAKFCGLFRIYELYIYLENSDSVGVEIGVWALDASRYNFISTTSGKLRRNEINSA